VPVALTIWYMARRHVLRNQRLKDEAEIDDIDGVIKWTPKNTVIFPLICTSAGLIAGVFGQGAWGGCGLRGWG